MTDEERDPDPVEEPCLLTPDDDSSMLDPVVEQPVGPSWWEGRWPVGGINSMEDLGRWVEHRLEEMISLQVSDTLGKIGRLLGVQAVRNADRYLGRFGRGDHPQRPYDDQLERIEDVEDALEQILRYLRQQDRQSAPAGSSHDPTRPAARSAASPSVACADRESPLREWSQPELTTAIREYVARLAPQLDPLREGAKNNRKDAIEAARKLIGRNALKRALRVRSGASVSNSPAYREIAAEFNLDRDRPVLSKSKVIGLEIPIEEKALSGEDPVVEEVARREAADFIRSKLDDEDAEPLLDSLERGTISPDQAMEYAKVMLDNRDDTRTRPKPR